MEVRASTYVIEGSNSFFDHPVPDSHVFGRTHLILPSILDNNSTCGPLYNSFMLACIGSVVGNVSRLGFDTNYYAYMDVCMVITYSNSKDQPGKVANPARGQLNRENEDFPVPVHT